MKVVLSLGTNTDYANIEKAEERLSGLFSAVRVSRAVVSPAVETTRRKTAGNGGAINATDKGGGAGNRGAISADFANAVMIGDSTMPYEELRSTVKGIEQEMGRKRPPEKGRVEIDIDILQYGDVRYKAKDWERSYNVLLLKELGFTQ